MNMPHWQSVQVLWAEVQRLAQHFEQRLVRLEEENRTLKEMIERIRPLHIGNITYKVQELHVKELSGTLNIGLSAFADPEQLEKWLAKQEQTAENPLEDAEVQFGDGEEQSEGAGGAGGPGPSA